MSDNLSNRNRVKSFTDVEKRSTYFLTTIKMLMPFIHCGKKGSSGCMPDQVRIPTDYLVKDDEQLQLDVP